jgi:hypothetical protein
MMPSHDCAICLCVVVAVHHSVSKSSCICVIKSCEYSLRLKQDMSEADLWQEYDF